MVTRSIEGPLNKKTNQFSLQCNWCRYDQISGYAKVAVIASEDQRFAEHNGFDFEAIEKAMQQNSRSHHVRGASTISQQVAKNIFLWPSRNWIRKGIEVYFTFLIEHLWSKERILQMYLNIAETGDGLFGVQAAAQKYFHKNASQLNYRESAMIAAILPNPREFDPKRPSPVVLYRQVRIIRFMRMIGGRDYLENL
jgi:monofunctional biosynthetic peptidoglycan transglycosylase